MCVFMCVFVCVFVCACVQLCLCVSTCVHVCVAAGAEHEGSFYQSRGLVCVPTVWGLTSTITA